MLEPCSNKLGEVRFMARKKHQFPLVGDDESVIAAAPQMRLYDNEDLINNIHGDYHDKPYLNQEENSGEATRAYPSSSPTPANDIRAGKTYAELAREEARQDLKRKRQSFIAKEAKIPSKPNFQHREQVAQPKTKSVAPAKPTLFLNGKSARSNDDLPVNELARFSKNLHQDRYILAELPKVYKEPSNPSQQKVKKNNYDFLKRSQIYNQDEIRQQRTHQLAKELNLMVDEEWKEISLMKRLAKFPIG